MGPITLEPAAEVLAAVARRDRAPFLRTYVPEPTVAFGRLDALSLGYPAAVDAAREHGFTPIQRAPGGRAAAYHQGCLVVEEFAHHPLAIEGLQERFREHGARYVAALCNLGVDARLGEVPGEYCRGRFSVNARGAVKLVGTAQRIVRDGYLFATVVNVTDAAPLREVLVPVYAHLEQPMDPEALGVVSEEVASITVDRVREAVISELEP